MSLTRAKYRATPDTLQDLQWTDLRVDANGALIVTNAAGATSSPSKLEDAAHASGDMGNFILAVRNDAAATLTTTDLDYTPIATTLTGALQTALGVARANGSDAVSNTGVLGRVADVAGNTTFQGIVPYVFNGTTWDRLRSVGAAGSLAVEQGPYLSSRKTADGQVKGSAGFVHTVTIAPTTATPTAGLLTIYDSLTETGTILYSEWIFATTPGHSVHLDVPAATGIYVGYDGTLANVSVAVSYR